MLKLFITLLLLTGSCLAQTVEKRTGDIVYLAVCGAEGDSVRFYRQTTPISTPTQVGATVTRLSGVVQCKEIQQVMPSGTTAFYRFVAVPYRGNEALESTNGVRVKRTK